MSEEIGKHKGAVETLLHEKKELSRLLQIVNSQLERHLSALEEKGVDTDRFIQQVQQKGNQKQDNGEKRPENRKNRQKQRNSQDSKSSRSSRNSQRRRKSGGSKNKNDLDNEEQAEDVLENEEEDERDFSPL